MLLVDDLHLELQGAFGAGIGEGDGDGRLAVELDVAELVLNLIADIGMEALHDLAHEGLGTELEDFVRHIHLVDDVVVTVETCGGGGLVGGVLDDDRHGAEIGEGRAGILQPRHAAADDDGKEEPLPLGGQIDEEVKQVDVLAVLGVLGFHI